VTRQISAPSAPGLVSTKVPEMENIDAPLKRRIDEAAK
jgi:hypothetical protein